MRIGIATDHGGYGLKQELLVQVRTAGHEVYRFWCAKPGPRRRLSGLCHSARPGCRHRAGRARRGHLRQRRRGICLCKQNSRRPRRTDPRSFLRPSGGGGRSHKYYCMGGRTVGPAVAWDLVQTFLEAKFSQAERHLRRLGKLASLEETRGVHGQDSSEASEMRLSEHYRIQNRSRLNLHQREALWDVLFTTVSANALEWDTQ